MKGNRAIACLIAALCLTQSATATEKDEMNFIEACTELQGKQDGITDAEKLHRLFEIDWENRILRHPESATYSGYPGQDDRWTDESLEAIELRAGEQDAIIALLASIKPENLGESDRLSYDLLLRQKLDEQASRKFHGELLPINQMGGVHASTTDLISMMSIEDEEDASNILSRMNKIPEIVGQNIMLMEKGLAEGLTPPKITMRDLPQQVLDLIVDDPSKAPIMTPFTEIPDEFDAERAEDIRKEASQIYRDDVVPALKLLHTFLVSKYIPNCRESIGLSDLPNGKEWYEYLCRHYTTTDMTPQEIHETGLREVKRIRSEMEAIIKSTGFEGSFDDFLNFLRSSPQFYFSDERDLVREYRDISKRADAELVKLFGRLPRLPYGVIEIPDYAAKSQTTAYYQPGSLKAHRPGYYYVNTYDLASRPKWEMEALSLHEAVPGHHLQISIAQELENVPEFRRHSWITAYGEGWGLYAEKLGEEMGFYEDPYSKFGQLTYEMWRAIRLVVDVGMHYLGWSRQQAIDFFVENSSKSLHDITVEVDRYIVWPGQAIAYKIGELKIRELRAYAEKELGDDFDIRAFHDTILETGPIPLSVLEQRIRDWVETQRG